MKSLFTITTAMLLGAALALPAVRDNINEAPKSNKATVEAANSYSDNVQESESQKATVEAANSYTEFGWVGKRDDPSAEVQKATVEAANAYTEFGWVGKREN
ncbi:hypothetical protein BJX70DRAFT_396257 [Aspergillus crustosus]